MVPCEEHLIRLTFSHSVRRDSNIALKDALLKLLTFCNTNKVNVPPLPGHGEQSTLKHQVSILPLRKIILLTLYQIVVAPPPPSEIFAPSPPLDPTRLTSPPPLASIGTTPATATARDLARRTSTHGSDRESKGRSSSPAAMGYLEQAREGFRAVRAGAGAVAGWRGRGVGQ
jgi:autophagy-related protein 101